MEESQVDLSIILPIYEEEESLPQLISEICEVMAETHLSFEILCIDDGSTDSSFRVLRALQEKHPRWLRSVFEEILVKVQPCRQALICLKAEL